MGTGVEAYSPNDGTGRILRGVRRQRHGGGRLIADNRRDTQVHEALIWCPGRRVTVTTSRRFGGSGGWLPISHRRYCSCGTYEGLADRHYHECPGPFSVGVYPGITTRRISVTDVVRRWDLHGDTHPYPSMWGSSPSTS